MDWKRIAGVRRYGVGATFVAVAAALVACGGGGGGGSDSTTAYTGGYTITAGSTGSGHPTSGSTSTTTGASTGSTTATTTGATSTTSTTGSTTTTGATTGSTTTGATTGSTTTGSTTTTGATTGSTTTGSTTGSTTTGSTTGSTTTGSTTGSTTAGSTTGSTTTGATTGSTTTGSTTGSTTTGSTTTGSTTGSTTTGSTTGSTTTGSTTGSTTGGTGGAPGFLRPNAIYYGTLAGNELTSVLPDGSSPQVVAGNIQNVACVISDPNNNGLMIYAMIPSGGTQYGIYSGTTINPATSTTLVAPMFDDVSMLQAAVDGSLYIVGSVSGTSSLYSLRSGALSTIDLADSAAASLDGTMIAYTKPAGSIEGLFVIPTSGGTATQVVTQGDSLYPQFSKDGSTLVFSSDLNGGTTGNYDIYTVPVAGGTMTEITAPDTLTKFGASFNQGMNSISYVGQSSDPTVCGVYVVSGGTETMIVNDTTIPTTTYWTTLNGRARLHRFGAAHFQRLTRLKKRK